jgi:arylsulfatase A-like enzyme
MNVPKTCLIMKIPKACLILLINLVLFGPLIANDTRPNILYIFTDDQSVRTVGCYPHSFDWVKTPNIDRLASQGVRFDRAYMGAWCLPSRTTALTGKHAFAAESMRMEGKYPGSEYDPEQLPFWPKVFRENGYTTAQIGKWHTGTDTGYGRDWDFQLVWNRPGNIRNSWNYYFDQEIEVNGAPPIMIPGYSTDNYTTWAEDFITRNAPETGSQPWYLWLCYSATHADYEPAHRHRSEYEDIEVPVPADIFPPRPGKPDYMQDYIRWKEGDSGEPIRVDNRGAQPPKPGLYGNTLTDWVRQYHQTVLALDEAVGRLMKVLEETGQLENTLVVFTSDQGIAFGQHGFAAKLAPYDGTILAPLIISMPSRFGSGEVVKTAVSGVDLIPTFFKMAKIELPWEMHGHDLSPLLEDSQYDWDHPAMVCSTPRKWGSDLQSLPTDRKSLLDGAGSVPWYVSISEGDRYKYVRSMIPGDMEQLYDTKSDPEELTNLYLNPEYQDLLKSMRKTTVDELARTNAPFLDSLPPVGAR